MMWVISRVLPVFLLCAAGCVAQMTPDQKRSDFNQLAAMFAKNYGPVEWKQFALRFNLLNITDWLNRAAVTQSDLEFYDLCVEYVSSLDDAHSGFYLPSDFQASLPFSVDIYQGKTIVDAIAAAPATIPLHIGDELLAVDGMLASDLMNSFAKYSAFGNPVSSRRVAALRIVSRPQQIMPWASSVPDTSQITVRHADGGIDSFLVNWGKSGLPLTVLGPVISPSSANRAVKGAQQFKRQQGTLLSQASDAADPLALLHSMGLPAVKAVRGFGRTSPVFTLPATFVQRLGGPGDFFYSGTFEQNGHHLGYIRIPNFGGVSWSAVFYSEIRYMKNATDGLILDIMRNPGGDACFAQDLLRQVIPYPFHMTGLEVRATLPWLQNFERALAAAESSGASQEIIDQYRVILKAVQAAYQTPSGRSTPIPVCSPSLEILPEVDGNNVATAYDKPIVLLTDEFSASAADLFAAVFQDAQRGVVFGTRTMGAGGNVGDFPNVTAYSGGEATITESLMVRKAPIQTSDFGLTAYIENVGVRPDVVQDYMTMDNLLNGGRSFVTAFTNTLIGEIETPSKAPASMVESQRRSTSPLPVPDGAGIRRERPQN